MQTTFDAGDVAGTLYVATRNVAGTWLDALLTAEGPLHYARATELVAQLAAALDEAHARGLVHRGVRPSSIVVATEPVEHAYLTDFGLTDDTSLYDAIARAPAGMAPPGADYAPPEQILGQRVDARTDVYALGCMAFTIAGHLDADTQSAVALSPTDPLFFDRVIARAGEEPRRSIRDCRRAGRRDLVQAARALALAIDDRSRDDGGRRR